MGSADVRLRPAGDDAVLLDCGDLEGALRAFSRLDAAREAGELRIEDLVPAAETVLVRGGEARAPRRLAARLEELLRGAETAAAREEEVPETVIPVSYDGEDLAEVASLTGLSVEEVVERHTAARYTVAFTGFAPGFAYLSGGDPALDVPRRSSPRPRIEAGSVGLAGPFSGVYPRQSPGGWQLIGHTESVLWDLDREPPALLMPGGRVRFVAEREQVRGAGADRAEGAGPEEAPDDAGRTASSAEASTDDADRTETPETSQRPGRLALTAVTPGLGTLVQDRGRPGLADLGVSPSGAADRRALDRANRLVGNAGRAAALELGAGDVVLRAEDTLVLALAGAPRPARISGPRGERLAPAGRAFRMDEGETLSLGAPESGLRTVLALRGGVEVPLVLGSAAADTLAGLGPEPLAEGEEIRAGDAVQGPVGLPEPERADLPRPEEETTLRLLPGPRDDWFGEAGLERLRGQAWRVTPRSDRVGVRLEGEPLERAEGRRDRELPSEGLATGALQVPPDGQPVLFLADRPLTGGYPVIGVVREEDLRLAAQLPPGALVRFLPERPGLAADAEGPAADSPADAGSSEPGPSADVARTTGDSLPASRPAPGTHRPTHAKEDRR
ncbi:urea amidolyase family protein [Rothia halotolerans]|uniref:5-oxoprolinase subunit B/C family protein n=1 Tax=Rothia halotolerans TaxID=405770 RepID=UPI00101D2A9E|nr:urea amidolyase family protein [Rothia halotolerans]